jgi:hypothetical protein
MIVRSCRLNVILPIINIKLFWLCIMKWHINNRLFANHDCTFCRAETDLPCSKKNETNFKYSPKFLMMRYCFRKYRSRPATPIAAPAACRVHYPLPCTESTYRAVSGYHLTYIIIGNVIVQQRMKITWPMCSRFTSHRITFISSKFTSLVYILRF